MENLFNSIMRRDVLEEENLNFSSEEELKKKLVETKEYKYKVLQKKFLQKKYLEYVNSKNCNKFYDNFQLILENYQISQQNYKQCKSLTSIYGNCGLEKSESSKKKEKLFVNFLQNVLSEESSNINQIPHIQHRIWITCEENPYECPEEILQKYINSIKNFDNSWKHYFWCLNSLNIPKTIERLKNSGIIVMEIDKYLENYSTKEIFTYLLKEKLIGFSCNLIKNEIINKFGGIYFDMGFEVLKSLNYYLDNFDYLFYFHKNNSIIGNPDFTCFASKPNSKLIKKYLNITKDFLIFPKEVKDIYSKGTGFIYLFGCFFFLALSVSEIEDDEKVIYINDKKYFELIQMGSWSGECKFGNKDHFFADLK